MKPLAIIPTSISTDGLNDEALLLSIRTWRNRQLAASDWTQLPDASVDRVAWATYRQQLRDLPSQNTDPKLIVFPTPPK